MRVVKNEIGSVKKTNSGWPELTYDPSVSSRQSIVDEKIFDVLKLRVKSEQPDIRSRAAYSLGEIREISTSTLIDALRTENDPKVIASLDYAIKRSKGEIGPYWKTSAPEPYWKK